METSAQRSFAINPGTIKLPLSDKRAGEVTVTVTNSSQAFKKGFVRYVPLGATDPTQKRPDLVIDGEKERPFEKGAAQQFKIKVSAKPEVKEGTYQYRLDVANSADPEGDWTEGPAIEVTVPKVGQVVQPTGGGPKWWIFVVIGAAVLLIGGLVLFFVLHSSGDIDVPDLVGMTFEEAEKAAEDAHLKVEVADSDKEGKKDEDDKKDDKKDEKKDPKHDAKKPEEKKPEEKKAGDKKDDDKNDDGKKDDKEAGDHPKKSPKGRVKSQDPAAHEKASSGSVISVVLEKDEAPHPDHQTPVPSVKGLTIEAAKVHLYDAGFTPKVADPEFKGTTPGTINEQKPAAGTPAQKGAEVTITPEKDNIPLPSLLQKPLKDAIFELNRLKLIGQIVYQSTAGVAVDHVIDQNPKAGARVEAGSTVTITVPRGIALPSLPKEQYRLLAPATALMFATPNSLTGLTVSPASPVYFHRTGAVTVSCHYSTSQGGKAKIVATALAGGKQAAGTSAPVQVTDASGKGEVKLTITLRYPSTVDSIRVQLIGADGNALDTEPVSVRYSVLPF